MWSRLIDPQMKLLKWVQDLVSSFFYHHGLFCARYPELMILVSGVMVVLCCMPFFSLPMSMTVFHQYTTPLTWFHDPSRNFHTNHHLASESYSDNQGMQPQWFSKPPVGYVLQVVVNTSVYPWQQGLDKHDAFRGPLAKAFDINADIKEYVSSQGQATKSLCYYVTQTAEELQPYIPQHSCLVISPANAWSLDYRKFLLDAKPVKSLLNVESVTGTVKPDLTELLIGFSPWHSGFKRHTIRSRSRQITYAVTLILHTYNESFVRGLQNHLQKKYNPPDLQEKWSSDETILHIHYKSVLNFQDISVLGFVYCLLLLYVYFSVSRIEMVKSKWGLALSAILLVSLSPLMAVGVTLLLGVETTLNEGEIFPYLVIIIGLENILVVTKSVALTQTDQDVPTRIATGLKEEGWYIMKNLCAGLIIVLWGYLTFVPAIQEFCILALVAMLTDFFLQMCFFVPVLSLDFRRKEHDNCAQSQPLPDVAIAIDFPQSMKTLSPFDTPSPNLPPGRPDRPTKVPFAILLASLRILQRLIMTFLLVWIVVSFLFIYHSGLAQYIYESINSNSTISSATNKVPRVKDHLEYLNKEFLDNNGGDPLQDHKVNRDVGMDISSLPHPLNNFQVTPAVTFPEGENSLAEGTERFLLSLWLSNKQHWRFSAWHWPALLNFYNISLSDRYISILPPIKLNIQVGPEEAIRLRLESEKFRFDSYKDTRRDDEDYWKTEQRDMPQEYPHYNYYLTLFLGVASGASLVILLLLLCWCSQVIRNKTPKYFMNVAIPKYDGQLQQSTQCLKGHKQEVEILISRKGRFVSACLGGEIRLWDYDGREVMCLDRASHHNRMKKSHSVGSLNAMLRGYSCGKTRSLPRTSSSSPFSPYEGMSDPSSHVGSPPGTGTSGRSLSVSSMDMETYLMEPGIDHGFYERTDEHARSVSPLDELLVSEEFTPDACSPIWCLAFDDEVLMVGCSDGKIELWDINFCRFITSYEESTVGITDMVLRRNQLVVSRLDGTLQFLVLQREGRNSGAPQSPLLPGSPLQNGMCHGLAVDAELFSLNTLHEHKGPVNKLILAKNKVVSAGQDHLIKVFSLDGNEHHHTLHGHTGAVTTLCYNSSCPNVIVSGSTDVTVRTWDIESGNQLHRMKVHQSTVLEVTLTKTHVASIGGDSKLCIWDQQQGLLVHTIQFDPGCSNSLVPLGEKYLVTTAQGSLIVLDILSGKPIQLVDLGDKHQMIHHIVAGTDNGATVVCDYGRELRMVQFHLERSKSD